MRNWLASVGTDPLDAAHEALHSQSSRNLEEQNVWVFLLRLFFREY